MVKVALFTGYDIKKDENKLGKRYATEEFITFHAFSVGNVPMRCASNDQRD